MLWVHVLGRIGRMAPLWPHLGSLMDKVVPWGLGDPTLVADALWQAGADETIPCLFSLSASSCSKQGPGVGGSPLRCWNLGHHPPVLGCLVAPGVQVGTRLLRYGAMSPVACTLPGAGATPAMLWLSPHTLPGEPLQPPALLSKCPVHHTAGQGPRGRQGLAPLSVSPRSVGMQAVWVLLCPWPW